MIRHYNELVEPSPVTTVCRIDLENLIRQRCHAEMDIGSAIFIHNVGESCWSDIWLGDVGRPSLAGQLANLLECHKSQGKLALVRWASSRDVLPTIEEFDWVCEMNFGANDLNSAILDYIVCCTEYYLSYTEMSRAGMLGLVAPTCIFQH